MLDAVKNYSLLGLAALVAVLGLSTCQYRRAFNAEQLITKQLNTAIDTANKLADDKLKRLKGERDALQVQVNKLAAEKAAEKKEFDHALEEAQRTAPKPIAVRVREHCPATAGGSGGGAQSGTAAEGPGRDAATDTVVRLLPDANSQRLERALTEVELLSRDFNTAKRERDQCYLAAGKE